MIYLASQSPQRIYLLKKLIKRFKVIKPTSKEIKYLNKTPLEIIKNNAIKKAQSVLQKIDGIVISADTIVVCNKKILGKPKNISDAKKYLKYLSGRWHSVLSGVYILNQKNKKSKFFYEETKLKMKKLTEEEIEKYSKKNLDKAGGYAVQEKKDPIMEKIVGDYYNAVGLPLKKLKVNLKKVV